MLLLLSRPNSHGRSLETELKTQYLGEMGKNMWKQEIFHIMHTQETIH